MISTTYIVITPRGQFLAEWDEDEEIPVQYAGDPVAIAYFYDYMALEMVSGPGGLRLEPDYIEPGELYGFCQSEKYGITVIPDTPPTPDDEGEDDMQELDAATPEERKQLIDNGREIVGRLGEGSPSFFADARALRAITAELSESVVGNEPVAFTIQDVAEAMKKTKGWDSAWWADESIDGPLRFAQTKGWVRRPSTTQVEWTDAGVAALNDGTAPADDNEVIAKKLAAEGLLKIRQVKSPAGGWIRDFGILDGDMVYSKPDAYSPTGASDAALWGDVSASDVVSYVDYIKNNRRGVFFDAALRLLSVAANADSIVLTGKKLHQEKLEGDASFQQSKDAFAVAESHTADEFAVNDILIDPLGKRWKCVSNDGTYPEFVPESDENATPVTLGKMQGTIERHAANPDQALLQSVIDGTADMASPALLDQLEAAYERIKDDPAMMTLFNQAAEAYSNYAVQAAKKALG